jgi:hypothetical protein
MDLIDQFFEDEADDRVREILLRACTRRDLEQGYLTFNAFNVRLDYGVGIAVVEDELNPEAEQSISISELIRRLEQPPG